MAAAFVGAVPSFEALGAPKQILFVESNFLLDCGEIKRTQ